MIIATVLQTAALFGLYRDDKQFGGTGLWTLGSMSVALGFLFHSLRAFPSLEQIAIISNNMFFFAGLALLYAGVKRFLGTQIRGGWSLLSGFAFTLLLVNFTYLHADLTARRVLISLTVAAFSFLIAKTLLRHSTPAITDSAHFIACVMSAFGLFFLLRMVATYINPPAAGIFSSTVTQSATYLVTLVASTLWTFGLILMVNQRLNAESREASEKFELIFATSPDAVLITRMSDGCFVDINEGFTSLTGYTRAEVIGKTALDLNLWHDAADRQKVFSDIHQYGSSENIEALFYGKSNRQIFGSLSAKAVELKGVPHIISVTRDIAGQKKLEAEILEREAHYRLLTEDVSDVVWRLDSNYCFLYISPADEHLRGYKADEVLGHHVFEIMTEESAAVVREKTGQRLEAEKNGPQMDQMSFEVQQLCRDGSTIWTEILSRTERDAEGTITGYHGITRNISERKQTEMMLAESNSKLEALSITDGLTAIANRRHFDKVLAREHARHIRSGAKLSLILLDIDFFKSFNDTYGHVKGDECLRQVSQVLVSSLDRPADLAARYGGEEFACIMPETDHGGAIMIAEKIRHGIQMLAVPHKASAVADCVTASLGLVTVRCMNGELVDSILTKADELLYQAKSSGRNRVEFVSGNATSINEMCGSFLQLSWKDTYCCGNKLIDDQHQALFCTANDLFDAIFSGYSTTEISGLIDRLLADITQHFRDEQAILEKIGFAGVSYHAAEHASLLAKGAVLLEQFNAQTLSIGSLFQFLAYDMIMLHMFGADREYAKYMKACETESASA